MSNYHFDNAEKKLMIAESILNEMSDKEFQDKRPDTYFGDQALGYDINSLEY